MRKFTKILLPMLCVVALMVAPFSSVAVSAATPNVEKADAILSNYDVDTWNGM